ncbi:MAG: aspartate aminotransferase family protein [Candidatus Margulisbacteria bacterium]|nr:aspartate aminotransferase family protein [Candidatus Margulisiibacteriota bacterium]
MATSVFHRHTHAAMPTAVSGEGCYLIDQTGKRYFDGSGGAAVSCLGHGHPEVIAALQEQAAKMAFAHTSFFTNEPMEKLASFLVSQAPAGFSNVYFVSGGSEAVEASIKMARQYFLEIGKPDKYRVIARRQSYHGNTLGALSAGGNLWRRKMFDPLLLDMSHLSPCYAYRGQENGESEEAYGLRVANELETEILRVGPETVSAFIAEPVVGATMGCVAAVPGYFKRIREICDRYNVLLILDEVMCGMGRTGTLFACEFDGVVPDLITLAKGLGAGYQPIGALMVSEEIFKAIQSGSGFFQHGHTYMGHATACATALKVQEIIQRDQLLDRVNKMSALLFKALHTQFDSHPHVGDIRGRGLFLGLELVEDRASKRSFASSKAVNVAVKKLAMQEGLMCYPMGGTIDGQNGDHIMLAPPFIMTENHVDEIVSKLAVAIDKAIIG